MNELYFDDKKFVSTKRGSELTKYTKDYIGQLARAGKVQARLVGRNWYVEEASLLLHADGGLGSDNQAGSPESSVTPLAISVPAEEEVKHVRTGLEARIHEKLGYGIDSSHPQSSVDVSAHEVENEKRITPSEISEPLFEEKAERFAESETIPVKEQYPRYSEDSRELIPMLSKDIETGVATKEMVEPGESLEEQVVLLKRERYARVQQDEKLRVTLGKAELPSDGKSRTEYHQEGYRKSEEIRTGFQMLLSPRLALGGALAIGIIFVFYFSVSFFLTNPEVYVANAGNAVQEEKPLIKRLLTNTDVYKRTR